jgi:hypothetical protein
MSGSAVARNGHLFFVLENVLGPILFPKRLEPWFSFSKKFSLGSLPKND